MLQTKPKPDTLVFALNKPLMYMFFIIYLKAIQKRPAYAVATRAIVTHILNAPERLTLTLRKYSISAELVLSSKYWDTQVFELTWPFLYRHIPKTALRAFFKQLKATCKTKGKDKLTTLLNQIKEDLCKS